MKGTPNKRTVAKLEQIGRAITATAKQPDVVRAMHVLADLTKTAVGFAGHYQQKMMAWEADPKNKDKVPPPHLLRNFQWGLECSIKAAKALAPFQDPTFAAIKVSVSPFDAPDAPKLIEGKPSKIDLNDPVEVARVYSNFVRAA